MLRKPTLSSVAVLLLLEATSADVSSAEQSSISVSLVIQESCVIRSAADPSAIAAPSVACLHDEPYDVAIAPLEPTQALSTTQIASGTARHAVWTVSF